MRLWLRLIVVFFVCCLAGGITWGEIQGLTEGLRWGMKPGEVRAVKGDIGFNGRFAGFAADIFCRFYSVLESGDKNSSMTISCRQEGLTAVEYVLSSEDKETWTKMVGLLDRQLGAHKLGFAFDNLCQSVCLAPPGKSQWHMRGMGQVMERILKGISIEKSGFRKLPDLAPEARESFKGQLNVFFEPVRVWPGKDCYIYLSNIRHAIHVIKKAHYNQCRSLFLKFARSIDKQQDS